MIVADKNRDVRTCVVLAVVCLVLQLALAPNLGLGNGRANLALVFASLMALLMGGSRGVIAGFVAGLVFDLSTTGPIGLMAFCLTVSSFVLGLEGRDRMSGDFASSVALFSGASLIVSLVYHLAMLLVGQASSFIDVLFLRTLPTAVLSIAFFLPFAYYFARLRSSGPSLGGRGGHFSTKGL
ncbi:rod shape-determining protein MreD [Thermophilibacter provencensis]|uniref:Rod shape-determining protein MreD n=1 Tax=Thermophilibacter provencensis TaxID=1852386 RepID=A0ABT7V2V3_9ACTN|nr:rod shape-determining protein MreD [Thermophilibacter provencensis]MDM8270919.1 rod shape-determining protein MreD [Thermophilibacter provencensis]